MLFSCFSLIFRPNHVLTHFFCVCKTHSYYLTQAKGKLGIQKKRKLGWRELTQFLLQSLSLITRHSFIILPIHSALSALFTGTPVNHLPLLGLKLNGSPSVLNLCSDKKYVNKMMLFLTIPSYI